MVTRKTLDGKPYAGNTHAWFDVEEVTPAETPRRLSPFYRVHKKAATIVGMGLIALSASAAQNDATMNWCGWRESNTSTAIADRDLTTFRNWFDTDNPYSTAGGYWWHEKNMVSDKTGAWVNPKTHGTRILVQWNQGGCGYVNSAITNVCEVRFGIGQAYNPVLRIDEGGCISNVNIQVGGFRTLGNYNADGKNARLHINGGSLFAGTANIEAAGQKGLNIGHSPIGEGGVFMTGGRLEVNSGYSLTIGWNDGGKGYFALSNGTVRTLGQTVAGPLLYNIAPAGDSRIIVDGGEWQASANIIVRNGGTLEITGGNIDAPGIQFICGGTGRMSGGHVTSAITFFNQGEPSDKSNVLNITNAFFLSGGTLVTGNINLATDGKGWLNGRSPARFVQEGGIHTNANLWAGSGHARYEISGGTYWVNRTWVGGYMPFYFRIQGTPTVSAMAWASNGAAENPDNCLIEHVIDERGLAPITFRGSNFRQAHGHQRLRPLGGVQVVTTNFFPLFRFNRGSTVANRTLRSGGSGGTKVCWGTWPDASLWTLDPFNTELPESRDVETVTGLASDAVYGAQSGTYYDVGCTLNAAAEKGVLLKSGKAVEFAATPMGYLVWPNTGTNGVTDVKVSLKVSAPEGGTLEDALGKVCAGLVDAGYSDVVSNASAAYNVSFVMPWERVPVRNAAAKFLFDFTETPVPAEGLTTGEMALPTVTNALVSGVSCYYNMRGTVVLVR